MANYKKPSSVFQQVLPTIKHNAALTRREFLLCTAPLACVPIMGCSDMEQKPRTISDLQAILDTAVEDNTVPGVSAALVKGDKLLWQGVAGFADLNNKVKFTTEHMLNIASVSKTITATAVMQQIEKGVLNLDQDVNDYLDYSVRNPQYPDVPITVRQLLIHRSSITDGSAYDNSYACGDPAEPLGVWIEQYLKPGGKYYNAEENFLNWAPGAVDPPTPPRTYSNVAYGLLGHLVAVVSGQEFEAY